MITYDVAFAKTQNLIDSCNSIFEECTANDNFSQTFFIDDDYKDYSSHPFLYYAIKDEKMIGFLSTYPIDKYNVEFCLYVLPDFRRNHIASELFFRMVTDFDSCSFKCMLTPDSELAKSFLEKMGFQYGSTECQMVANKKDFSNDADKIEINVDIADEMINISAYENEEFIGQAKVSASNMIACIHDVEIIEEKRGEGLGYKLVMTLLSQTFDKYDTVTLHVTKENKPAFNLYQKCGFKIKDVIEIYEL